MTVFQRLWLRGILVAVVLIALASISSSKVQDGPCFQLRDMICGALSTIAEYVAPPAYDQLDAQLLRLGFDPAQAMPLNDWKKLSTVRKIEVACLAALRGKSSCATLLNELKTRIAEQYESIDNAPLSLLLNQGADVPKGLKFNYSNKSYPSSSIPANLRALLLSVADQCCSGVLELRLFVQQHLDLSMNAVFTAFERFAGNKQEVFIAAATDYLHRYGEAALIRKIKGMVRMLDAEIDTVRYDRTLDPFRDGDDRSVGVIMPQGPDGNNPGGAGVSVPTPPTDPRLRGEATKYIQKNNEWENLTAPSPNIPQPSNFDVSVANPNTAGGVIFGNALRIDSSLGDPKSATFRASNSEVGGLVIQFKTKSGKSRQLTLTGVNRQGLFAAQKIYYKPFEKLKIDPIKDSVSLVGFTGRDIGCADQTYLTAVIHPAIITKSLGWAAVYTDTFGFNNYDPIERFQAPAKRSIYNLFSQNKTLAYSSTSIQSFSNPEYTKYFQANDYLGTWKINDVEMHISADGDRLNVERNVENNEPKYPQGLRRTAFLEMRLIKGPSYNFGPWTYSHEFAERFYRQMPVLIQASEDFAILNEFARTMAVVRWLKSRNATLKISGIERYATKRTPTEFVLEDGYVKPFEVKCAPASR
jgi:hypothetical protein